MGQLYYLFSPWAEKLFAYVADQHVVIARKEYICADEQSDALKSNLLDFKQASITSNSCLF